MPSFADTLDAALREYSRDIHELLAAAYVLATADETLALPLREGESTDERIRFEAKLREAVRLARLLVKTVGTDIERHPIDEITETLRDACVRWAL